jgi:hypothetical protein
MTYERIIRGFIEWLLVHFSAYFIALSGCGRHCFCGFLLSLEIKMVI